jgi:hypothetical protein
MERCLACEAVVNRETSLTDALTLAARYGVGIVAGAKIRFPATTPTHFQVRDCDRVLAAE